MRASTMVLITATSCLTLKYLPSRKTEPIFNRHGSIIFGLYYRFSSFFAEVSEPTDGNYLN